MQTLDAAGCPHTVAAPSGSTDKIVATLKLWYSLPCEQISIVAAGQSRLQRPTLPKPTTAFKVCEGIAQMSGPITTVVTSPTETGQ